MAIDRKRLLEFRKEISDLQNSLNFEEFYRTIKSKILDSMSKDSKQFGQLTASQQRRFIQRLFLPGHSDFVKKIFASYQDVLDVVNSLYSELGVDVNRDFSKIVAIERVNRSQLGDYSDSTVKDIAKVLRKSIIAGDDFKRTSLKLKSLDEKVVFYADTIARTQVKGYARAAKTEKARIAEVFFYEYVGIKRQTTRPFCLALLGTTQHIETINKMRNANHEPVVTYCGGWNCHHDWEPDPFAKETSEGTWQESQVGKKTMKVYSENNLSALIDEYEERIRASRKK